jgi:hypothetical protein
MIGPGRRDPVSPMRKCCVPQNPSDIGLTTGYQPAPQKSSQLAVVHRFETTHALRQFDYTETTETLPYGPIR